MREVYGYGEEKMRSDRGQQENVGMDGECLSDTVCVKFAITQRISGYPTQELIQII